MENYKTPAVWEKKGLPAKRPDHPVMTEYVMPPLLEKRRGIDACMIGQIYPSTCSGYQGDAT